MLPVITVPRPGIEKLSSTGIKNGLSRSRTGNGMCASTDLKQKIKINMIHYYSQACFAVSTPSAKLVQGLN